MGKYSKTVENLCKLIYSRMKKRLDNEVFLGERNMFSCDEAPMTMGNSRCFRIKQKTLKGYEQFAGVKVSANERGLLSVYLCDIFFNERYKCEGISMEQTADAMIRMLIAPKAKVKEDV